MSMCTIYFGLSVMYIQCMYMYLISELAWGWRGELIKSWFRRGQPENTIISNASRGIECWGGGAIWTALQQCSAVCNINVYWYHTMTTSTHNTLYLWRADLLVITRGATVTLGWAVYRCNKDQQQYKEKLNQLAILRQHCSTYMYVTFLTHTPNIHCLLY